MLYRHMRNKFTWAFQAQKLLFQIVITVLMLNFSLALPRGSSPGEKAQKAPTDSMQRKSRRQF